MSLTSTIGGDNSNSYVSRQEANDYFLTRHSAAAWHSAEPVIQNAALVSASHALDDSVEWIGEPSSATQSMGWPRKVDSSLGIDDVSIPFKVKRATFEAALHLLQTNQLGSTSNIDSIKIGPIELNLNEKRADTLLPNNVASIISGLGDVRSALAGSGKTVRLVRA